MPLFVKIKSLNCYINQNLLSEFTIKFEFLVYMSLSKTIQEAQLLNKTRSKAKRNKFRQQRRRDDIEKIMSSSRKQLILSNKKGQREQKLIRSQPQNKQKLKQLLQIVEAGHTNSQTLFDMWIYLKSYTNFFQMITKSQITTLTKYGLNIIQDVSNSLESRHSLEHILLIILNWIGKNYHNINNYNKKLEKQLQYQKIITLCIKTLELDLDSLNPYVFLCLGNFVKIPDVKTCLLQNLDICQVYQLKIKSQVVQDLSFFTLNLLSTPLPSLSQKQAQSIISFLQKRFFMINNIADQQNDNSYFFLKLDYLQIIQKLTLQQTLPNRASKKKLFPRLAYLFQLFNEIRWENQQDNGNLFDKQQYEKIYWDTFTRICSIPLGQVAFDANTIKTVFKLSTTFLKNNQYEKETDLKELERISRKKSQVWQFLITFCKYQSNGFPQLINNFYLCVLKVLLQENKPMNTDKQRQFLCEVDQQMDNPKSKNIQILQYIISQIKCQEDPKMLSLLLQKVKRMLRSLKKKQYDNLVKSAIDLQLKLLSYHQQKQVQNSASQICKLLSLQQPKFQEIEKYEYDNANQLKSKEKQSKSSRFSFTD